MSLRSEAIEQGLTSEEYDRIVKRLGREPNHVELGIFAVMWSEHCCYKSSQIHLKTLPTQGPLVIEGPGENAGIIDIGDGWVLAFKIESHNHPSFIEPFQGAATGVGGILRDVFTMGARPVAILDSLAFGDPSHEKTPYLVHGVVGGIAGYGNCMGIPTVAGEVRFDPSYNGNNLVNAMAVGIARREHLHKATAKGEGNIVLYLGSKTGRDGIHGATMASEQFGEGNEERRPTVQVGDPFTEKLLLEACMELMQKKLLVGIQDMGAAGITCSTFEMSARGESGMEVQLDRVPPRETGMSAYEIFLSESQERMLLVATPEKVSAIKAVAQKWGIDCVEVGKVITQSQVRAFYHGEKVVDLPVLPVTDEGPMYDRPWEAPKILQTSILHTDLSDKNLEVQFLQLVGSANLCSRRQVFRQYDHMVGTDTVVLPGADASVLRVKDRTTGFGVTVDSNCHYCAANPYEGTQHVVAETVRNLACVGARAVAVTNCLNFGNPEDPDVMGEFRECVRGLGDACRFFETPVTGGNVSFYNQTGKENIKPTPTIGMVGLVSDVAHRMSHRFQRSDEIVALLGDTSETRIFSSEYAREILKRFDLACPPLNLKAEQAIAKTLIELIEAYVISSAHDCSDGGLALALMEACLGATGEAHVGVTISVPPNVPAVSFLFGEYGARALISFAENQRKKVEDLVSRNNIPFQVLGQTGENHLRISNLLNLPLSKVQKTHEAFFQTI